MKLNAPRYWSKRTGLAALLYPLSLVFSQLVAIRRWCYRRQILRCWMSPVPLIVVGNITVGGAGKTPMVIALVEHLRQAGRKPAIVTRGYGGEATDKACVGVYPHSDPVQVGDEAVLLARRTMVPVVASRDRPAAVRQLLAQHDCDVVVCDDGLQHYALQRDIEIIVVDSETQFGNGFCLPAGPLREPVSRLKSADIIVYSGRQKQQPGYSLKTDTFISQDDLTSMPVDAFVEKYRKSTVHAFAAIANPQKFFATLRQMGLDPVVHEFPDHHLFSRDDFGFSDGGPLVMTEKDKVKCGQIGLRNAWYLKVSADVDGIILDELDNHLAIADKRIKK